MKYLGLQSQINRNNIKSVLLLFAFPCLLFLLLWMAFFLFHFSKYFSFSNLYQVNRQVLTWFPLVISITLIWFVIAWFFHAQIILKSTGSIATDRKSNPRIYNLTENICISRGIIMPKIFIMKDDSLNAFSSGIDQKTFAISLSTGIIDKLSDQELEAVIAHELTHIINRDVRLLITSIIFVGIFSFIAQSVYRLMWFKKKQKRTMSMLIVLLLGIIGYVISLFLRFAISRKREFLADAGAVELTKNPLALASALKKIDADPFIEAVNRQDVAQLFIDHPIKKNVSGFFTGLFDTHPPIKERIEVLENF